MEPIQILSFAIDGPAINNNKQEINSGSKVVDKIEGHYKGRKRSDSKLKEWSRCSAKYETAPCSKNPSIKLK